MILGLDTSTSGAVTVGAEVPYFPEDLMDHSATRGPEPLRPWLKSLRNSRLPHPDTTPSTAQTGAQAKAETQARLARRSKRRAGNHARLRSETIDRAPFAEAHPTPPCPGLAEPRTLGEDLLEALALALAREHETLSDRLFAFGQAAMFVPAGSTTKPSRGSM
jgi:hypothetical protein